MFIPGLLFCLNSIWDAVQENNLASVKKFIEKIEIDPNILNEDGLTPIFYAASNNDTLILEYLISKKANFKYKAKNGATPIAYAIDYGNYNAVKVLLEKGVDINSPIAIKDYKDNSVFAAGRRLQKTMNEISYGVKYNNDPDFKTVTTKYNIIDYAVRTLPNENKLSRINMNVDDLSRTKDTDDVIENRIKLVGFLFDENKRQKKPIVLSKKYDDLNTRIAEGNLGRIKELIKKGVQLDSWSVKTAIILGRKDIIKYFIDIEYINGDELSKIPAEYLPLNSTTPLQITNTNANIMVNSSTSNENELISATNNTVKSEDNTLYKYDKINFKHNNGQIGSGYLSEVTIINNIKIAADFVSFYQNGSLKQGILYEDSYIGKKKYNKGQVIIFNANGSIE
jgi:ankyrin repeat protein